MRKKYGLKHRQPRPEVLAYEEPVDVKTDVLGTLARLNDIFQSIIKKQADKIDPVRSSWENRERGSVTF